MRAVVLIQEIYYVQVKTTSRIWDEQSTKESWHNQGCERRQNKNTLRHNEEQKAVEHLWQLVVFQESGQAHYPKHSEPFCFMIPYENNYYFKCDVPAAGNPY